MERFTCRTCLAIVDADSTFQVFQKCSSKKTIKDVLLEYVPSMEKTLSENERICIACLNTIDNFLKFIEKCFEIEDNLNKDHITVEKIGYVQNPDIGDDIQVVENIQIVLDDELIPLFDEPGTSKNNSSTAVLGDTIDHDHSYMKPKDETGIYVKTECPELGEVRHLEQDDEDQNNQYQDHEDQYQDSQDNLSSSQSIGQDESFEQMGIRFIPVGTVSDQMLAKNFGEASTSSQENMLMSPNITVLATGDEFESDFLDIKDESNESLADCEGITFYQALSNESNIYICELCGDGFLSQQLLQQHFTVHGKLRIMCDKCPKIFKNDSALKAHFKLKHLECERFKCDICGQLFARADYLRNHLKRHEDEKKNNVKCRVPGKFLRFKNTDDPLPCKICGKYYNGIQKLKVHLQTHLVVKRFACEYCDLTYKRWPSLKRHEKTHLESDQFFYRCNVCWKRFAQKEELEVHMNQHGNPRYRCQVCDEQFHRKYLFDNHYLLSHATPEDIENSKKEVIYDTLLELSSQNVLVSE